MGAPDAIPYPFEFALLDEDWEHFQILMDNAMLRIPALWSTPASRNSTTARRASPDNQFILGEAPELTNFFVAAGFNSVGIASAGEPGAHWRSGSWPVHPART
jgi:4-methylaminobutanoate oxidase (formaldehyde-forming)